MSPARARPVTLGDIQAGAPRRAHGHLTRVLSLPGKASESGPLTQIQVTEVLSWNNELINDVAPLQGAFANVRTRLYRQAAAWRPRGHPAGAETGGPVLYRARGSGGQLPASAVLGLLCDVSQPRQRGTSCDQLSRGDYRLEKGLNGLRTRSCAANQGR